MNTSQTTTEELAHLANIKLSPNIKKYPIFEDKKYSGFKEFLLNHRIKKFLLLKILFEIPQDEFKVGFEFTNEYLGKMDENGERILENIGASSIPRTFTKKEVIDGVLLDLDIAQIDVNSMPLHTYKKITKTKKTTTSEYIDLMFIISTDGKFLSTQQAIYTSEDLSSFLQWHEEDFNTFLEKHHNIGVPHETYVIWLQQLFPGKIKFRLLK